MKGYFETVPISLERAALVDGCTRLQALYRVIVPIARPGIMAAVIFCFILAWNHFLYAQILATSMRSQTIPVVMAGFTVTQRWYSPGVLFASGLLAILFPVGICLIFQRRLVGGMVAGAQKG
jgi:multiple sugar transport system permease protein